MPSYGANFFGGRADGQMGMTSDDVLFRYACSVFRSRFIQEQMMLRVLIQGFLLFALSYGTSLTIFDTDVT